MLGIVQEGYGVDWYASLIGSARETRLVESIVKMVTECC